MTLSQFVNETSQLFGHVNFSTSSAADIFIVAGLIIAFIVVISAFAYGMFKLAKALPNMSVKQFILFLVILSAALILIGIFMP
ncbi:hypothetical protein DFR86_09430 [Acidianus sulfidivorans JP7]|uniref:Uncharacterized protein n=1 Tax=Acidianus sulfidivorans JP7 TaxID=619593 RepID=A0A2U9IP38_9CREN|nr:hypothetical protein [Acidianus sulfidivorans]AWR97744.1 hypothetical protein DFR86_09430 [Acidianus sulfidivorans JP7]